MTTPSTVTSPDTDRGASCLSSWPPPPTFVSTSSSARTCREWFCGLNTIGDATGAEPGTKYLYVWLECGAYRTGPAAESLSAGADPAIVTVRDDSDGPRIERVEFPPLHYTFDQLGDMFPPDVIDKLRSRPLPVSPTDDERLATAAEAAPAS